MTWRSRPGWWRCPVARAGAPDQNRAGAAHRRGRLRGRPGPAAHPSRHRSRPGQARLAERPVRDRGPVRPAGGALITALPGTNVFAPRTTIPTLKGDLPPGEHLLACAVVGLEGAGPASAGPDAAGGGGWPKPPRGIPSSVCVWSPDRADAPVRRQLVPAAGHQRLPRPHRVPCAQPGRRRLRRRRHPARHHRPGPAGRGLRPELRVLALGDAEQRREEGRLHRRVGRRHRRTLPGDRRQLFTGGIWSAYYYNGHVYGSEIARGPDVFELTPPRTWPRRRSPPRPRSGTTCSTPAPAAGDLARALDQRQDDAMRGAPARSAFSPWC